MYAVWVTTDEGESYWDTQRSHWRKSEVIQLALQAVESGGIAQAEVKWWQPGHIELVKEANKVYGERATYFLLDSILPRQEGGVFNKHGVALKLLEHPVTAKDRHILELTTVVDPVTAEIREYGQLPRLRDEHDPKIALLLVRWMINALGADLKVWPLSGRIDPKTGRPKADKNFPKHYRAKLKLIEQRAEFLRVRHVS